jgi:predicted amidohydrolase
VRVAAVQMTSADDRGRNLAVADRLTRAAAREGARLVVLPELFPFLAEPARLPEGAEDTDGPTLSWARGLSRELGIWLAAGSYLERHPSGKAHNTACLVAPDGTVAATYRKVHLFDCDVPGAEYHESDGLVPGQGRTLAAVTAGGAAWPAGLAICYDLRFPELFRALTLSGARLFLVPAAFTERTGRDHWELLLRARAVENQAYIVAANQFGLTPPGLRWYGRSMIVDPWGTVLATASDREGYILADLDGAAQDAIRARLPCLRHRRPEAYA